MKEPECRGENWGQQCRDYSRPTPELPAKHQQVTGFLLKLSGNLRLKLSCHEKEPHFYCIPIV